MSSRLLTTSNMGLRNNPAGVTHLATTPSCCSCHISMSRVTSLSPHQQQSSRGELGLTCWVIISVPLTKLVIDSVSEKQTLMPPKQTTYIIDWHDWNWKYYLVIFSVCLRPRKVSKILNIFANTTLTFIYIHVFKLLKMFYISLSKFPLTKQAGLSPHLAAQFVFVASRGRAVRGHSCPPLGPWYNQTFFINRRNKDSYKELHNIQSP